VSARATDVQSGGLLVSKTLLDRLAICPTRTHRAFAFSRQDVRHRAIDRQVLTAHSGVSRWRQVPAPATDVSLDGILVRVMFSLQAKPAWTMIRRSETPSRSVSDSNGEKVRFELSDNGRGNEKSDSLRQGKSQYSESDLAKLFHKQQLPELHKLSGLDPVVIHAAGKSVRIEDDLVVSGLLYLGDQGLHLAPQIVIHL
jgi:hypothetical protein